MKFKNQIVILTITVLSLILNGCDAQIKNEQTKTLRVYGNCSMCKKTIETAANKKGVVKANWNEDTKILSLLFDTAKTNVDEVLKRIADAGYDNERFTAPDKVYANLHECCQYERMKKPADSTSVK